MLLVDEFLKLKCAINFRLISGDDGLENEIRGLGIYEYEIDQNLKQFFSAGDIVLTTLFFAKNEPELAERALLQLLNETSISCIAIKNICFESISDKVIELSNRRKIPIFLFEKTFFEDIIVQVSDTIKKRNDMHRLERLIEKLITSNEKKHEREASAFEINPAFMSNIIAMYCTVKNPEEETKINKILMYSKLNENQVFKDKSTTITKFRNGILVLHSFDHDCHEKGKKRLDKYRHLLTITPDDFFIGVSDVHHQIYELDKCILESIYTVKDCIQKNISMNEFCQTGINMLLRPLYDNYWMCKYCEDYLNEIKRIDQECRSELLDTAIAYIDNHGKINKTSDVLFQHRNTVRYRINKLKSIICLHETDHDFYEQLYLIIKYYQEMKQN